MISDLKASSCERQSTSWDVRGQNNTVVTEPVALEIAAGLAKRDRRRDPRTKLR